MSNRVWYLTGAPCQPLAVEFRSLTADFNPLTTAFWSLTTTFKVLTMPHPAFIDGWTALETLDRDAVARAREAFARALSLDPRLPAAHIGMATACLLRFEATRVDTVPDREALAQADQHAPQGCRLDRLATRGAGCVAACAWAVLPDPQDPVGQAESPIDQLAQLWHDSPHVFLSWRSSMLWRLALGVGVIVLSGVLGAQPSPPSIYVGPTADGFEVYITAAIHKKKVPVTVVKNPESATYKLTAAQVEIEKVSTGKKLVNCLFAYCAGSEDKASTSVELTDQSGAVVWSYAVNKGRGAKNRQSMAEAIAKHLRDDFFRRR